MVIFEALNALHGDCLLLRFGSGAKPDRLWLVDGGPKSATAHGADLVVWKDVLLPRLKQIDAMKPVPIDLAVVSHIDDDHIFGLDKLANRAADAKPHPGDVAFRSFWFNSFERLVGDDVAPASLAAMGGALQASAVAVSDGPAAVDKTEAVLLSVGQGNSLAAALRALNLDGNSPFDGPVSTLRGSKPLEIDGAKVTVLGPSQKRLEKLRKLWNEAKTATTTRDKQAALQELFAPPARLDRSVPNLSSIVLLVEIGAKRLLLSGDARGDHIVEDWEELGLSDDRRRLDVMKVPHHGSWANNPRALFEFFEAEHYVFSGDGGHGNPSPKVIEGLVEMHGQRSIKLHFTNADVVWDKPHKLVKGGETVDKLRDLLAKLRIAYPGPWQSFCRDPDKLSVEIEL